MESTGARPGTVGTLRDRRFITFAAIVALGISGWLPTLNFISLFVRDELGGSLAAAALLLVVLQGPRAVAGPLLAFWVRALSSRRVYALGLAGLTLLTAVLAATPSVTWVLAVAPLSGLALMLHWAGLQTYTVEVAPAARRGTAAGIISFVSVVAPGLAGLAQGFVAEAFGFRVLAVLASAMLGLALLGALAVLPPAASGSAGRAKQLSLRAYLSVARDRRIATLLGVRASGTLAWAAFVVLAGPKLLDAGGDLRTVGVFTLMSALGGAAAQIAIGRISDAIGRRGLLLAVLATGAAASATFGLASSLVPLLLVSAVYFFAAWASQTLMVAFWGDLAEPGTLGWLMALDSTAYAGGVALGALVIVLTPAGATTIPFLIAAAAMLVGMGGLSRLARRSPDGDAAEHAPRDA